LRRDYDLEGRLVGHSISCDSTLVAFLSSTGRSDFEEFAKRIACCRSKRRQPWETFDEPAGQRCQHQRHNKGCAIYERRPLGCRTWNCRCSEDTVELSRLDRTHYVIDVMPDFITLVYDETGALTNVEVVQIWVDPSYPDAHRDPALRAYIERRGEEGIAAIVRYSELRAITIFPPIMSKDGEWHEVTHGQVKPERTALERFEGIASTRKVKVG
jgi:Fe-S-cluster containining protein